MSDDTALLIKEVKELLSQLAIKLKDVDLGEDTFLAYVKEDVEELVKLDESEFTTDYDTSYYDSRC